MLEAPGFFLPMHPPHFIEDTVGDLHNDAFISTRVTMAHDMVLSRILQQDVVRVEFGCCAPTFIDEAAMTDKTKGIDNGPFRIGHGVRFFFAEKLCDRDRW